LQNKEKLKPLEVKNMLKEQDKERKFKIFRNLPDQRKIISFKASGYTIC